MRHNAALITIVACGLALRVIWLLAAQPTPVSDFHAYRMLAEDLIDHRQLGYPARTSFYLPMQPAYLAVWMLVSRAATWLALAPIVASTASVGLIYAIGRRIYATRQTALIAAALFAFVPMFVLFSPVLATEHLFVLLMLAAMLAVVTLGDGPPWLAVVAGGLAGLAMLTRGEAVFYIPALVLFVWVASGISSVTARIRTTLLIGLGVLVIIGPWYVRNALVAAPDAGLSTGAGINFYFAHNDSGTYGWYPEGSPLDGLGAEEANRLGWELGLRYLREHPLSLVDDIGYGTVQLVRTPDYALFWSTQQVTPGGDPLNPESFEDRPISYRWMLQAMLALPVLLVLGLAALVAYRRWSRSLIWLIVPLIVSTWMLRTVVYWAKPRYGYFLHVMLVFVAAITISALVEANRGARIEGTGAQQRDAAAGIS
ncbi:MAG: glycosyltransferase family 39 protein [Acidimicrobiia bacterium]